MRPPLLSLSVEWESLVVELPEASDVEVIQLLPIGVNLVPTGVLLEEYVAKTAMAATPTRTLAIELVVQVELEQVTVARESIPEIRTYSYDDFS